MIVRLFKDNQFESRILKITKVPDIVPAAITEESGSFGSNLPYKLPKLRNLNPLSKTSLKVYSN